MLTPKLFQLLPGMQFHFPPAHPLAVVNFVRTAYALVDKEGNRRIYCKQVGSGLTGLFDENEEIFPL